MIKISPPNSKRSYATITPHDYAKTLEAIPKSLVIEVYKNYGAILFRGFELSIKNFKNLTTTFCTHAVINLSPGRETIDAENNIQAVDPGVSPFPLHPEMSRLPWKPDVCFFGCLMAPFKNGETIFCDGTKIVRSLPARILKQINKRKIKYSHEISELEAKYWLNKSEVNTNSMEITPADCPFEFHFKKNKIIRSFTTPFLHHPMFVNKLAFGNYLLFSRYIHNNIWFPVYDDGSIVPIEVVDSIKKAGDKNSEYLRWQINDVMMIDNTRFLHGRNKIENITQRKILTYFGFLNFAKTKNDPVPNARWRNPQWKLNY